MKKCTSRDAYNLAVNLIKVYVERGDTIQELKSGQGGCCDDDGYRTIGGYINKKRYDTNNIIVETKDKQFFIFKLNDIFNDIKNKQKTLL